MALGERRRRRAVGDALGDEARHEPAGPVVDDGRRLVAAPPPRFDEPPDGVDVLAEAQLAVEPVDRAQRLGPHDDRRRRHVAQRGSPVRSVPARGRGRAASGPARSAATGPAPGALATRGRDEADALVGEVGEQAVEPAGLEPDVGVDERDERGVDRAEAGVAGDGRAGVGAQAEHAGAGTAVTGGSEASSTAMTTATPGQQRTISASAVSPSTRAGTTTVTSAAVNGDLAGRGWIAPASSRRSTSRSVAVGAMSWPAAMSSKAATPAGVRRNTRSGDPPMTTSLPGGRDGSTRRASTSSPPDRIRSPPSDVRPECTSPRRADRMAQMHLRGRRRSGGSGGSSGDLVGRPLPACARQEAYTVECGAGRRR